MIVTRGLGRNSNTGAVLGAIVAWGLTLSTPSTPPDVVAAPFAFSNELMYVQITNTDILAMKASETIVVYTPSGDIVVVIQPSDLTKFT